ncbi:MAG: bifunctional serine/threonine-protein kinase/formylglycine-generating enzyme family protein [Prevotellaceae bacterium]|nr:bifunctional serine/threonine-protein kinase/formylglycine-generating enzyme family protein [Prevotellaceae bacterium]MDY6200172.1 bifunctional serine/threonine-protein kinase/formylglycine-generating enzyme family protein [Prevotella sp.]
MADNKAIHKFKSGDIFDDRYTLEKLIGVGGFADVWKAVDNTTHSTVALKIYTNLDDDGINDLSEEYTRMQNLNHTNILKADHFDRDGNIPYLVMKFCGGGSLDKKIGRMENEDVLKVIKDMASGLSYLHQCNIVHQDIKPANILIDDSSGTPVYVLSDFGISSKTKTRLSHSVNQKNQGTSMTEAYAPPEKFSSKKEDRRPDRKGDIFSFGISIYELVTGGLPFDELSTGRQLQYDDAEVDFDDIEDETIRDIVERCMEPNKEDRPSAEDILDLLDGKGSRKPRRGSGHNSRKTVRVPNAGDSDNAINANFKWIILSVIIIVAALAFYMVMPESQTEEASTDYKQEVDTFSINGVIMEMVKIPGGSFNMGCTDPNDTDADANEKPAQKRTVSDFYMGKYEVTQKLWFAVMNSNPSTTINDNYPVNNVSWDDCQLFIQRLNAITGRNFRLPTETEWEYAAKVIPNPDGTPSTKYSKYAGGNDPDACAWYASGDTASNGSVLLHAVGKKKANAFGLYDMSGNVIEWCQDLYTNYGTGTPEIDQKQRVLRGGYYDSSYSSIRCTSRGSCESSMAMPPFGLRLCLQ